MILSRKLLARYRELKQEVPACLLLMQVGAFMQVMAEDARTVSQVTGLTLQMAGAVDDPVVPHLLVGHLEPRWERRFIHCRLGQGYPQIPRPACADVCLRLEMPMFQTFSPYQEEGSCVKVERETTPILRT
jgi:hypothetical protein